MLQSKCLLFAISLSFATGELCHEPGLALVADGTPVDHLMLTEATEVMLLGEGECDVMVSYLAVGGGGGYFGAGGGSGEVTYGQVSWPAGGFVKVVCVALTLTCLSQVVCFPLPLAKDEGLRKKWPEETLCLMMSFSWVRLGEVEEDMAREGMDTLAVEGKV